MPRKIESSSSEAKTVGIGREKRKIFPGYQQEDWGKIVTSIKVHTGEIRRVVTSSDIKTQ